MYTLNCVAQSNFTAPEQRGGHLGARLQPGGPGKGHSLCRTGSKPEAVRASLCTARLFPRLTCICLLSPEVADEPGDQRRPPALHLHHLEVSCGSQRRGLLGAVAFVQAAEDDYTAALRKRGADRPIGSCTPGGSHREGVPHCAGSWQGPGSSPGKHIDTETKRRLWELEKFSVGSGHRTRERDWAPQMLACYCHPQSHTWFMG